MLKAPDFCPRFQKAPRAGFSIVELLVVMLIGALITGFVSVSLKNFEKVSRHYLNQTLFESAYLIFLLKFEEDYQEAEIGEYGQGGDLDTMFFYRDRNWDGDYADEAERIEYRWNESKKQVDLRSRRTEKARFEVLLNEIAYFEWNNISIKNGADVKSVCHQMKIRPSLSDTDRIIKYCRGR